MKERIRFFIYRLRERLWIKPLVVCLVSILIAFLANMADQVKFLQDVPMVRLDSLNTLLGITSGSMLGVATFAVGSMVTAYSSASMNATPRAFPLILADDVSQNTLSSFIGALIFSIVAKIALENDYYGQPGRFILFIISVLVFGIIIFNFIRWIDRIARLGRLGNIIDKVENATQRSLMWRKRYPYMGGIKASKKINGVPLLSDDIGYLIRINVQSLQRIAEENNFKIHIDVLPGDFVTLHQPLAYIESKNDPPKDLLEITDILDAFKIDDDRALDQDPQFGLVILSEIASRALSTAVNDPGTAIDIIGSFIRLFSYWAEKDENSARVNTKANRVFVPELSVSEMIDDAFNAISRDGASLIEVNLWLQKAFKALASLGHDELRQEALLHSNLSYCYAEKALVLPEEKQRLEEAYQAVKS